MTVMSFGTGALAINQNIGGDIITGAEVFLMLSFKAKIFENRDYIIGIRRDNQGREIRNFHICIPFVNMDCFFGQVRFLCGTGVNR